MEQMKVRQGFRMRICLMVEVRLWVGPRLRLVQDMQLYTSVSVLLGFISEVLTAE